MTQFKGTKKWLVEEYYEPNTFLIKDASISEEEHNLLLISKAPEMIEMLENCERFMDQVQSPRTSATILKNEIKQLIKEATEI